MNNSRYSYKNVKCLFFSGTGGTERVAKLFFEKIKEYKINIEITEIRKPFNIEKTNYDLLLIFFPIYAFNAPYIVIDYINKLSRCKGIDGAVISISGGGEVFPNLGCRNEAINSLEKKGYNVFYEDMIIMPSNFFEETPEYLVKKIIEVLPRKIDEITADILFRREKRIKLRLLDTLMSKIAKLESFGGKIIGKKIKVSENCIKCGKCVKNCPTENISIVDNKFKFKYNCVLCMKCFYNCPNGSIKPLFADKILIKTGYTINKFFESEDNLVVDNNEIDLKAWNGIKKYLE